MSATDLGDRDTMKVPLILEAPVEWYLPPTDTQPLNSESTTVPAVQPVDISVGSGEDVLSASNNPLKLSEQSPGGRGIGRCRFPLYPVGGTVLLYRWSGVCWTPSVAQRNQLSDWILQPLVTFGSHLCVGPYKIGYPLHSGVLGASGRSGTETLLVRESA